MNNFARRPEILQAAVLMTRPTPMPAARSFRLIHDHRAEASSIAARVQLPAFGSVAHVAKPTTSIVPPNIHNLPQWFSPDDPGPFAEAPKKWAGLGKWKSWEDARVNATDPEWRSLVAKSHREFRQLMRENYPPKDAKP